MEEISCFACRPGMAVEGPETVSGEFFNRLGRYGNRLHNASDSAG